ncbi:HGG motif-containing protein [Cryptosporidium canis]|uniref:HGG motif-containing protein n=1 Tax=Cryptosporidium canis TaxID=195482 RepID=A0ABQ8P508_9CRYT|nr:HGG motif-containing protein [Cryptosporidium canis]KAJ1608191.1 HGG motif-containing protein [Cryptosporidium canis]
MEDLASDIKLKHLSIPSTVSTSTDSIDIDSVSTQQTGSKAWLDQILGGQGVAEITEGVLSSVKSEKKLMNTLITNGCIASTKIYLVNRAEKSPLIVAIMELGKNIESHPNVVHGGFSATLVDNCLGVLAVQLYKFPVTKTLNLCYKKPIHPGQTVVVVSRVKESDDPQAKSSLQSDRCTLISEILSLDQELLLSAEAVFVDISARIEK